MITLVLCYGVVKALHLENTKEGILIMIVSQIVSTAALNFIYNPTAIALWGGGAQMADPTFEMKWWMQYVYDAPYIVIQFIIVFIFYKLYKPERQLKGGQEYFETEYAKLGAVTVKEKKGRCTHNHFICVYFLTAYPQIGYELCIYSDSNVILFTGN